MIIVEDIFEYIEHLIFNYLNSAAGVLARAQEERPVYKRIPVEHMQGLFADGAGHAGLVLPSERGQYEQPRVVVAMVTLVLDL